MQKTLTDMAQARSVCKALAIKEGCVWDELADEDINEGIAALLDALDKALDVRCPVCLGSITLLTLAIIGACGDCDDKSRRTGELVNNLTDSIRDFGKLAYLKMLLHRVRRGTPEEAEAVYEVIFNL